VRVKILDTDQRDEWDRLVESRPHDFYHLASYHHMAEEAGEGSARLVVLEDRDSMVLFPILVRRVAGVPGLERSPLTDVTSVYGYAGPLVEQEATNGESTSRFRAALAEYFDSLGACCVFSRLHPLLPQVDLLGALGPVKEVGPTVSIDLTAAEGQQWAEVRHGHKYDLSRLRRASYVCLHDEHLEHLDEFVAIYRATMRRVGADEYYMFDHQYFRRLFSLEGVGFNLFLCLLDGVVACGGLFSLCGGIVQYHLSGTREEFSRAAPTKLMLDEVRKWAATRGVRVFHLGGGVGSRQDSLFKFKAGFSKRRHTFRVWRWVRDEAAYAGLISMRAAHLASFGQRLASASYFPAYRSPAVACSDFPR